MTTAYIGIGANLGDRRATMVHAVRLLGGDVRAASLYEATPVGGPARQPNFLNSALQITTELSPRAVLAQLQRIETALGRVRQEPDGPRTIDLDLLLFGHEVMDQPGLVVPHPRLHLRGFVLVPLSELTSNAVHPVFRQSIGALCEQWANSGAVDRVDRVCGPEWIDEPGSGQAIDFCRDPV